MILLHLKIDFFSPFLRIEQVKPGYDFTALLMLRPCQEHEWRRATLDFLLYDRRCLEVDTFWHSLYLVDH